MSMIPMDPPQTVDQTVSQSALYAKTHRSCLGEYTRTDGNRTVTVTFHDSLGGWIAAADWDRHLYTDPLDTKREAVVNADYMLRNAG